MANQKTDIIKYMQEHGGITNVEAVNLLAIGNLKARINELRNDGYQIKNVWKSFKTIHGRPGKFVRYELED